MEILFQDAHLLVIVKPAGLEAEHQVPAALAEQLGLPAAEIRCVHRLDRGVGGVMVYARTAQAAADLSRQVADRALEKEYLALVRGLPDPAEGSMEDLLYHDARRNKSFVVTRARRGVKPASLDYRVLGCRQTDTGPVSLVRVDLHTGRPHQIRVQFASRTWPLLGDGRYGGGSGEIALWARRLRFSHPATGAPLAFSCSPPMALPWGQFPEAYEP